MHPYERKIPYYILNVRQIDTIYDIEVSKG